MDIVINKIFMNVKTTEVYIKEPQIWGRDKVTKTGVEQVRKYYYPTFVLDQSTIKLKSDSLIGKNRR